MIHHPGLNFECVMATPKSLLMPTRMPKFCNTMSAHTLVENGRTDEEMRMHSQVNS